MKVPELSVIVPAYREGPRIHDNLLRLLGELDQLNLDYEVVVVSDGNTDQTEAEARRVPSERMKVVAYEVNQGKGFALMEGVRKSTGEMVVFIDADMELNPHSIGRYLDLQRDGDYDVVIGSKLHPESVVSYPFFRRVQSTAYRLLIRLLFQLDVRDTQTGLKLFRGQLLRDVIPLLAVKRFAFDLELLVVARKLGFRKIAEAPVELNYRFESTTNMTAVYNALWDTAAIFYRLRFMRFYDRRRTKRLHGRARR